MKNSYDDCWDFLEEEYPFGFDLQDAITLLESKGEEENDIRFLLASLVRNGVLDYEGTTSYRWMGDTIDL